MNESRLLVGRVGRPFGVRGFCRVRRYSDNPARFLKDEGQTFVLADARKSFGNPEQQLVLEGVTVQGDSLLLKWKGVNSPEELRMITGWNIFWPGPDDWTPEDAGEVRINSLIGLTAVDCETKAIVGIVSGFYERSGQDLLLLETSKGEVMCPFVEYLVPRVNMAEREVHVRWSVVGTSE